MTPGRLTFLVNIVAGNFLVNIVAGNAEAHARSMTGPHGESLRAAADAIRELSAALATAKDEERAAVVAHADAEAARMTGNGDDVGARFVRAFGDVIESNRHREKA